MELKEGVALIRQVPMFAKLDSSKQKLLAFTGAYLTFEDGEVLFQKGDVADAAYVIVLGRAEVLSDAGDLAVAVLDQPNELFGEISIICNAPRSATMRAQGRLEVLKITADMFLQLITENPPVALEVMRQLSQKLVANLRRFDELEDKLQARER